MIFLSGFANRLPLRGFQGASLSSLLSSVLKKGGRDVIHSFGKRNCSFSSTVEVSEFEHDGFHDDAKSTEKDAALYLALSRLSGDFDKESPLCLRRFFGIRRVPVVSTGSLKLDLALGVGGLPKGRFVEIYGLEASGKTTLALHIIKEAQKAGGVCAYFDVENAIDPFLVESMGVDTQSLLISHPNSAENLLSAVDTLTKSGAVDVIVVDSVAALVPQCEIDVSLGSSIWFKSSDGSESIDEYTCGGNALKFYAAIRLRLKKTGLLENENKEVTGLGISVQVVKNKLAPAMKKAELGLQFGRGFRCESEVLELACNHGVIVKEGNSYLIEGEVFSNKHAAEKHLAENEMIYDNLVSILRKLLFETRRERR
ncbi:hypothetical protein G4B88_029536 [Cannabis sativa]|uniref:Uncharacterized protein n=1 Tax=Cannabis sativa TaxID=3483 RepID=A0A7J6E8L2_CANSA|nr:hypothetical protein G4B88_029536 [Cannabis sativa]